MSYGLIVSPGPHGRGPGGKSFQSPIFAADPYGIATKKYRTAGVEKEAPDGWVALGNRAAG